MKTKHIFLILLGFIPVLIISASALIMGQSAKTNSFPGIKDREDATDPEKTLSPYFFVKSEDPSLDQLPLKATSAEVNIAGVIADVAVTQEYANEGRKPVEAIYIFPASTRTAVYSMKMTIGERTIVAKIAEREKARKDYEDAKNRGQGASLLEQQRPNVFQMNVANILPGDRVKVELRYTETLIPEEGIYRFVFPTVVGPRYSNQASGQVPLSEHWVSNPYTHQGEKPAYSFNIRSNIAAGMAITDIQCPSHKTHIQFENASQANVILDPAETQGGNRDFIIEYRLSGNKVETGMLLFSGEKENFFLAMIQPPQQIRISEIPPREYVFIMDVSGSMYGYPIDISKKLMHDLIGYLRPTDRFNVLLFAGGSNLFSESSVPANAENLHRALRFIDKENGGGGTELLPALRKALELRGTEGYARSFVIATDGYVNVERGAFDLIRNNLNNANFFPFGIGTSVNRYLIEGLAHAGSGMPFVITEQADAEKEASRFRQYVQFPVLSHIKLRFEGFDAYDVEPISVPDVFGERPVVVFGKYRGPAAGSIAIKGISAGGEYESKLEVNRFWPSSSNSALQYLWAREKIRNLDDFGGPGDESKKEVTELGLAYNLLTRFTSFLAIDSEIRNRDGNSTTVNQPLPLPEGVSDYAVSGTNVLGYAVPLRKGMCEESVALEIKSVDRVSGIVADVEQEEIFTVVEQMPEFTGGETALKAFLKKNLVYPVQARISGIKGTVYVSFTVMADGSITDVKILRGIGGGCDEEALRVVGLMPNWIPGKQRGIAVKTLFQLAVLFKPQ